MKTLLLRLASPLQSWGVSSKFDTRTTNREPTKSGVVGLLAAALGRRRGDDLSDLTALKFAVRIDQYGKMLKDYHTARHPSIPNRRFVSYRYYLVDFVFVVGVEGDDQIIIELDNALRRPVFPLFLGRRSCPPTLPLVLEISDQSLLPALRTATWQASKWYRRLQSSLVKLEIVRETDFKEQHSYLLSDQAITFDPKHRQYKWRNVINDFANVSFENPDAKSKLTTAHDPMSMLD